MRRDKTESFARLGFPGLALASLCFACAQIAGISEAPARDTEPTTTDGGSTIPGGERTDPNIAITPSEMDFGELACGAPSSPKLVTIKNSGDTAAKYKVVIPEGTAFKVDGVLEGSVEAGGLVTLGVVATPVTAAETTTDLVVSAGNAVQIIHPKARGAGAALELAPDLVNFGDVRMQSGGGPIEVVAKNSGTMPITVTELQAGPEFEVKAATSTFSLGPGQATKLEALLKPAQAESAPLQMDVKPKVTGSLCGAPPTLTLKGRRVNSNVTISSGDWGSVKCTTPVGAKDIVVSNYSPAQLTYTAALQATSAFTITSGASGTLLAGSGGAPTTAAIKVVPKPISGFAALVQENLTVTVSGIAPPEGGPRTVPLRIDVRGAVLTYTPAQILDFMSDGVATDTRTFSVKNSGNETIFLSWDLEQAVAAWEGITPSPLAPNETRNGSLSYKPPTGGTHTAVLKPRGTIGPLGPSICGPSTLSLQGKRP